MKKSYLSELKDFTLKQRVEKILYEMTLVDKYYQVKEVTLDKLINMSKNEVYLSKRDEEKIKALVMAGVSNDPELTRIASYLFEE